MINSARRNPENKVTHEAGEMASIKALFPQRVGVCFPAPTELFPTIPNSIPGELTPSSDLWRHQA